jgi:hypothetical protein
VRFAAFCREQYGQGVRRDAERGHAKRALPEFSIFKLLEAFALS